MKRLILFIYSVTLLFSCEQQNIEKGISGNSLSNEKQQKVNSEGTLVFTSLEHFFNTADSVSKLHYADFNRWEKALGFYSRFTSYKQVMETNDFSITDSLNSPIIFNNEDNSYDINSVNSGIAKLTDRNGIVVIGNATYLFSATEVAYHEGVTRDVTIELRAKTRSNKVISKPVVDMTPKGDNARLAPWEIDGKGNNVNDVVAGSNNPCWIYSRLIGRYYEVPVSPIQVRKRQSIDLLASYYHQKAFGGSELRKPQKFEASWNFEVYYAPCGICVPQYNPISGTYNESGVTSIEITLYDGDNSDVRNLSVPISATDYTTSGQTVVSSTTHLFTN